MDRRRGAEGCAGDSIGEKDLPDREILDRAIAVRKLTREAKACLILNDRVDLAVLSARTACISAKMI